MIKTALVGVALAAIPVQFNSRDYFGPYRAPYVVPPCSPYCGDMPIPPRPGPGYVPPIGRGDMPMPNYAPPPNYYEQYRRYRDCDPRGYRC